MIPKTPLPVAKPEAAADAPAEAAEAAIADGAEVGPAEEDSGESDPPAATASDTTGNTEAESNSDA